MAPVSILAGAICDPARSHEFRTFTTWAKRGVNIVVDDDRTRYTIALSTTILSDSASDTGPLDDLAAFDCGR